MILQVQDDDDDNDYEDDDAGHLILQVKYDDNDDEDKDYAGHMILQVEDDDDDLSVTELDNVPEEGVAGKEADQGEAKAEAGHQNTAHSEIPALNLVSSMR